MRNLTRMQGTITSSDEQVRQNDTFNAAADTGYYAFRNVGTQNVSHTFVPFPAIVDALTTLDKFQRFYGFSTTPGASAPGEATAVYYNRADLGIGRDMHCIDQYDNVGAIACYVRNFAAGDDGTAFTFGQSADVAFRNADNSHAFATVAMVFQANQLPRVFFAVYGADGNLSPVAALDRVGIDYQTVFAQAPSADRTAKLAKLGTPGVNFNNHIPSNCITCHGGTPYGTAAGGWENGGQFLPFDLDNFDFNAAHSRQSQESSFRALNQIIRRVAVLNTLNDFTPADVNHSIRDQIDGWYNNASRADTLPACTPNQPCFNSNYVPPGWDSTRVSAGVSAGATDAYRNVIRGNCRNCHIANSHKPKLAFDDEFSFLFVNGGALSQDLTNSANLVVADLKVYQMPHSLQSMRQFWLSPAPAALESYYRGISQTVTAADALHGATGGNLVTLDPQVISAIRLDD